MSPHHWHLIPVRKSGLQQVFLHLAHLELGGRLPSWKWWEVPEEQEESGRAAAPAGAGDAPPSGAAWAAGSWVADWTQLGTAKSMHISWRK